MRIGDVKVSDEEELRKQEKDPRQKIEDHVKIKIR